VSAHKRLIAELREHALVVGEVTLDGRHVEELTVATPAIRALLSHASGLQREQPGDMWETMLMPSQKAE
jgi:hypothetical protein